MRCVECLLGCGIVVGQCGYGPVFQVDSLFVAFNVRCQRNALGNALEVFYGTAKIDASHCLDKYGETLTALYGWQHEALLVFHTVDFTDVFSVDKHLGKIVAVGNGQ